MPCEEVFHLLINSIVTYGISFLDPKGEIQTWNSGAEQITGHQAIEIIGKNFSQLYSAEDRSASKPQKELQLALSKGRFEDECWRIRKDGSRFWASVVISAIHNPAGKLIGFSKMTSDLTERKRSENELKKSRSFLDSLIENIPNMVFVKDAKDLRFVRFNKVGEELLGYPRTALIGKNDYDFFPKEQADAFTAKDRAVLSGRTVVDIPEEPIQTQNGIKILHTKKIPLHGESGEIEYLLGVSEDITERKKAEEERLRWIRDEAAMKEREAAGRKRMFLAEASMVLAASLNYHETLKRLAKLALPSFASWCMVTVQAEDRSYERIVAISEDPNQAPFVEELPRYCPTQSDCLRNTAHVIQTGKSLFIPNACDTELLAADMHENHLKTMQAVHSNSCMIVPIQIRDKTYGVIAFASGKSGHTYDSEDLSLAEELGRRAGIAIDNALLYATAQKAIETRDEFMSIASHELKTPITSLKLQLQLTKRRIASQENPVAVIDPKLMKAIDHSSIQVERLTNLIETLLDISRIQLGKLEFTFEPLIVSELVNEVIERFSDQLEAAQCKVDVQIHPELHAEWDRSRIEQVIVNLLSNAIKYARGSPIHISSRSDGNIAVITVQDFGPGISEEKQGKIFDRFERAHSSRNISGLGLGLFIVRQITEGHQGTVHVESKEGCGAKFIVELPLFPKLLPLKAPKR